MNTTEGLLVLAALAMVAIAAFVSRSRWSRQVRAECERLGHPVAWRPDWNPGGGGEETVLRCICGHVRRYQR